MIDFDKLDKRLETAFAKETKESLLKFMRDNDLQRKKADKLENENLPKIIDSI